MTADDPFTAAEGFGVTALIATGTGRWEQARHDIALARQAATTAARSRYDTQLQILLALIDYHENKPEVALQRLDSLEAGIDRNGFDRALPWVHATAAEAALRLGDVVRAAAAGHASLTTAERFGRIDDEARALAVLGRVALADGDHTEARAALAAVTRRLEQTSATAIHYLELHAGAAELAVALAGSRREPTARRQLQALGRYARSVPIAAPRHALLSARSTGDTAVLRRAKALARRYGLPWEETAASDEEPVATPGS